jgi:hypothetical protein
MLGLKSFHVVVLFISIVLTAGFGTWGVMNSYVLAGVVSLCVSVLLVIYAGYFARKAQQPNLD